ncbi:hypothetical protein P9112_012477 [Eukaryota sp. TZLM1-RC]
MNTVTGYITPGINEDDFLSASEGVPCLLSAASENNIPESRKILQEQPSTAAQRSQDNGFTPLHHASKNNSPVLVGLILSSAHVDINAVDVDGCTPLHWAMFNGYAATSKALLSSGADLTLTDNSGLNPFHRLAMSQACSTYQEIVSFITTIHSSILDVPSSTGLTPLMLACQTGNRALVSILLSHGASLTSQDNNGCTCTHWAAFSGSLDTFKTLLSFGANPWVRDNIGRYPIHIACKYQSSEVFEYLLNNDVVRSSFYSIIRNKEPNCVLLSDNEGCTVKNLLEGPTKTVYQQFLKKKLARLANNNSKFYFYFLVSLLIFSHLYVQRSYEQSNLLSIIYLINLIVLLFSLFKIKSLNPGKVNLTREAKSQYLSIYSNHKTVPSYCYSCSEFKPLRAHHCSKCQQCVSWHDHHCLWIGKCIGYGNRKLFVILLFFSIIYLSFCCYFYYSLLSSISNSIFSAVVSRPFASILGLIALFSLYAVFRLLKSQIKLILAGISTSEVMSSKKSAFALRFSSKDWKVNVQSFWNNTIPWNQIFMVSEINSLV